jgi:hypothetical protein
MKLFLKIALGVICTNVILATSPSYAGNQPTSSAVSTTPLTNGLISRTSNGSVSMLTAPNTCIITASYVHMSSSTPNNVKADAYIDCSVEPFYITFLQVTIYKTGLITHYISGPIVNSGTVYKNIRFWYQNFTVPCSTSTGSNYYSVANVKGYYASDPVNLATGTFTSPTQYGLPCGTTW